MIVSGEKISGEIIGFNAVKLSIQTDIQTAENVLNDLKKDKKYRVDIKQHREKRSLDANAYYWVLIGKMADVLGTSKTELHNIQLGKYGALKKDGEERAIFSLERDSDHYLLYEKRHLYPTDHMEERKGVIYRWYMELKGSSEYNTKEMSRLIDGTVEEAKDLGIETLPPKEIERMKVAWGETAT